MPLKKLRLLWSVLYFWSNSWTRKINRKRTYIEKERESWKKTFFSFIFWHFKWRKKRRGNDIMFFTTLIRLEVLVRVQHVNYFIMSKAKKKITYNLPLLNFLIKLLIFFARHCRHFFSYFPFLYASIYSYIETLF